MVQAVRDCVSMCGNYQYRKGSTYQVGWCKTSAGGFDVVGKGFGHTQNFVRVFSGETRS